MLVSVHSTLPTASRKDTTQTKEEVATHREVVIGLCAELKAGCLQ